MFRITKLTNKYKIPISHFAEYVCNVSIKNSDFYKRSEIQFLDLLEARIIDNIDELLETAEYSDDLLFNIVSSVCAHELSETFSPFIGEDLTPNW